MNNNKTYIAPMSIIVIFISERQATSLSDFKTKLSRCFKFYCFIIVVRLIES